MCNHLLYGAHHHIQDTRGQKKCGRETPRRLNGPPGDVNGSLLPGDVNALAGKRQRYPTPWQRSFTPRQSGLPAIDANGLPDNATGLPGDGNGRPQAMSTGLPGDVNHTPSKR